MIISLTPVIVIEASSCSQAVPISPAAGLLERALDTGPVGGYLLERLARKAFTQGYGHPGTLLFLQLAAKH